MTPNARVADRFRIERHVEDKWWDPGYPPPGWWLIWKKRAQVHKTWDGAVRAMHRKIARMQSPKGAAAILRVIDQEAANG